MSRLLLSTPKPAVVWSTRWFDDEADQLDRPATLTIQVVIQNDERLAALSSRVGLRRFVQTEARSHAYAC